jgi:hypothetical protein
MGVWQSYRSLNGEQKQIIHHKQLDLNRPVDEILGILKPIAAFDAAEAKVGKWGCLAILAVVVAFLFGVFGGEVPRLIRLPIVLALLAWGVFGIIFWIWASRIDVSDYLRGFVVPLLTLFREDINRKEPMHLRLDLRAPTDKAKRQSVGKPYSKGAYYKIIDTTYLDPWLEADALFADGSRVHWAVTDTVVKHDKTKKTGGKYKSKTKYTRKSDIDLEVTLRKKEYAVDAVAGAKVKQGERSTTVKMSHTIKTKDIAPLPVRTMVDAMAGVYKSAQPVK